MVVDAVGIICVEMSKTVETSTTVDRIFCVETSKTVVRISKVEITVVPTQEAVTVMTDADAVR